MSKFLELMIVVFVRLSLISWLFNGKNWMIMFGRKTLEIMLICIGDGMRDSLL